MATTSSISGLDVPSLVSGLMAVERRPIETLAAKVKDYEARISSFGTISGLISDFQSAAQKLSSQIGGFSAKSSNESQFTVKADSTAVAASYSLQVSKLAQSQNLVAAGQTTSDTAIGSGTATTVTFQFGSIDISATNSFGGGTLSDQGVYSNADFTVNASATSFSLVINSSNNTLEGIRDAINQADKGVTASIINDGSGTPYRLALTSSFSGQSYSMKISTDGADAAINSLLSYDPAGTQNLSQTVAAQSANLKINGIDVTKDSNVISDAIEGVTLTLKATTTQAESITVARDNEAINKAMSDFVESYNALASQLKSRSAFAANGAPGGGLAGDGAIRALQNQLREVFNAPVVAGDLTSLSQIGITTQAGGSLKFDSAKFDKAVNENFENVSNLLTSENGFAKRFESWAKEAVAPGGLIKTRTDNFKSSIDQFNDRMAQLEVRMAAIQKQYTSTYTNLNVMLINMNKTTSYLAQQLG